jgi:hypothetical protein
MIASRHSLANMAIFPRESLQAQRVRAACHGVLCASSRGGMPDADPGMQYFRIETGAVWLSVRSNAARRRASQGKERHQHCRARRRHCVLVSAHAFMATDRHAHTHIRTLASTHVWGIRTCISCGSNVRRHISFANAPYDCSKREIRTHACRVSNSRQVAWVCVCIKAASERCII